MPKATLTQTTQETAPVVPAVQPELVTELTAEQKFAIAVDKTVAESGCTPAEATTMIDVWLRKILNRTRTANTHTVWLSDGEMFVGYTHGARQKTRSYQIFEAVIPHDQVSAEGSAHQAIEDAILDPSRDEFSLYHHQTGEEQRHCTVTTSLGTAA